MEKSPEWTTRSNCTFKIGVSCRSQTHQKAHRRIKSLTDASKGSLHKCERPTQNVISVNKIVLSVLTHFSVERGFLTKSQEKVQLSRRKKLCSTSRLPMQTMIVHWVTTVSRTWKAFPNQLFIFPKLCHHSLSLPTVCAKRETARHLAQTEFRTQFGKGVRHYNTGFTPSAAKYGSQRTFLRAGVEL